MAMVARVKSISACSEVAISLVHTIHRYCTQAKDKRLAHEANEGVLWNDRSFKNTQRILNVRRIQSEGSRLPQIIKPLSDNRGSIRFANARWIQPPVYRGIYGGVKFYGYYI
jgi:hypothetical protein